MTLATTISGGGGGGGIAGPSSGTSTDNAVARWDGTTGTALQDSALTVADVAGASVAVATTAGNALAVAATAPTAAAGASQAGKAASLAASAATASTDTDGAAAGGAVTLTGGAAARRNSGNANGGNVILTGGAAIGTGDAGQVFVALSGTKERPSFAIGNADVGLYQDAAFGVFFGVSDVNPLGVYAADVRVKSDIPLAWSAGSPDANGGDVGIARVAANVLKLTTGGTALGGWHQWAGQSYLAADGTNNTTTMATTGLSVTVDAGRKYFFKLILYLSNSIAADGAKIDFDGGSAAATDFRCHGTLFDTALVLSTQATALATDFAAATVTGAAMAEFHGSFEPSGAGTFIPRYAMNAATTGVLTLRRGSHLVMWDAP